MTTAVHNQKKSARLLLVLLLVFFGVIIIANIILVVLASNSWNGLWVEDAYEKGIHYNQTLEEKEQEKNLDWSVSFHKEIIAPLTYVLTLSTTDKNNYPINQGNALIHVKRITTTGFDQTIQLTETTPGTYTATINFPLKGMWHLDITIEQGSNQMQLAKRIRVE